MCGRRVNAPPQNGSTSTPAGARVCVRVCVCLGHAWLDTSTAWLNIAKLSQVAWLDSLAQHTLALRAHVCSRRRRAVAPHQSPHQRLPRTLKPRSARCFGEGQVRLRFEEGTPPPHTRTLKPRSASSRPNVGCSPSVLVRSRPAA